MNGSKNLFLLLCLFPVFGEVSCDSALQVWQPAVHPASKTLMLMLCTQWKDQNPIPLLLHPYANTRVADIKHL